MQARRFLDDRPQQLARALQHLHQVALAAGQFLDIVLAAGAPGGPLHAEHAHAGVRVIDLRWVAGE